MSVKAGIQECPFEVHAPGWIPALAGMMTGGTVSGQTLDKGCVTSVIKTNFFLIPRDVDIHERGLRYDEISRRTDFI